MKKILLLSALLCLQPLVHANVAGGGGGYAQPYAQPFAEPFTRPFAYRPEYVGMASYEYRPSAQISANVREEITRSLVSLGYGRGSINAQQEQQLRQYLAQTDLMRVVSSELRSRGYEPNSVATALSYWLITNYNIIHGTTSSDSQDAAVLRQAQTLLDQQGEMARLSDGEKQRAAEGLYWVATLQQYAYQEARAGTPGFDLNSVVADAHAALMTYGIDAYKLRLTNNGFEAR